MSSFVKTLDPAFQGAGQRVGTEIWRIEDFQPVPLPKSDYGKFYSGDSYIILQTTSGKGGSYLYDIHFWLGKDTSQDEAGTAAIKTVELDAILGGRAVQHREIQGHESDKFLSYFKPCIIPLEGGVASRFKKPEEKEFETRLYIYKGKQVVRTKQVPFSRSSLNHDDVFILDTKYKIYQFNAKALEVIQFLKEKYHEGTCDVAIVVLLMVKSLLLIVLDCGVEVFVWVRRVTQLEERKAAIQTAEEHLFSPNRPKATLRLLKCC